MSEINFPEHIIYIYLVPTQRYIYNEQHFKTTMSVSKKIIMIKKKYVLLLVPTCFYIGKNNLFSFFGPKV